MTMEASLPGVAVVMEQWLWSSNSDPHPSDGSSRPTPAPMSYGPGRVPGGKCRDPRALTAPSPLPPPTPRALPEPSQTRAPQASHGGRVPGSPPKDQQQPSASAHAGLDQKAKAAVTTLGRMTPRKGEKRNEEHRGKEGGTQGERSLGGGGSDREGNKGRREEKAGEETMRLENTGKGQREGEPAATLGREGETRCSNRPPRHF